MTWDQARQAFPQTWLLFEATQAHSDAGLRILDSLAVLETFASSDQAMREYGRYHRERPDRELYVAHTSREELAIHESRWAGIRPA